VRTGDNYNVIAQIAYSEAAGVDAEQAAFIAGMRSGYFQAVTMLNYIVHGNTYARVSAAISDGIALNYAAVQPAQGQVGHALSWDVPADQGALDAILGLAAGYVGECGDILVRDDFVAIGGRYSPVLRMDEVHDVAADYAIPQALINRLSDPASDTSLAVREGAEFALNAAVLNAVHRIRTMGHNWLTKLSGNVCQPFLVKVIAGTKLNRNPKWVSEVLHDGLHMFYDLTKFVATCMAGVEPSRMFTEAAFFRWPVVQPGTGIASSGYALWVETAKLACDQQMSAAQQNVYAGVDNAITALANDVAANAAHWAPGPSVHRASRNRRQGTAQQLVAYVYGMAKGLGISDDATQMQAASCVSAYETCPAMGARGLSFGKQLKAAEPVADVTAQNLGLDRFAALFASAW
jgi:hypothetical protein